MIHRFKGIDDTAQVASTVVEYAEIHRLEQVLGAGYAFDTWVDLGGLVHGFGQTFEESFSHVVGIFSAHDVHVEIRPHSGGKPTHELLHELEMQADSYGVHSLRRGVNE